VGVVAHGVIADGEASFRAHERHDAKIRVLREPTVQRDLELAVRATGFPIAEIDQSEANRLFQLVNETRRKEDPREMRFDGFDAVGTIGKGASALEIRDLLRERDFVFHVGMLACGPKRAIRYYPHSFRAGAILILDCSGRTPRYGVGGSVPDLVEINLGIERSDDARDGTHRSVPRPPRCRAPSGGSA